jgi:uncharacterized membrane protein YidH (DUF202 family)
VPHVQWPIKKGSLAKKEITGEVDSLRGAIARVLEPVARERTLDAMNRSSGIGLMVLGVVLVVVGAIMRFAISAKTSGFDIHQAGVILLVVGIGVVVVSLLILALGGRSRSTTRTDVRETPSGQERTEQRDDWSTP